MRSASGRDNRRIDTRRRALVIALVANAAFLSAEVVGGLAFGSLALFADAVHMISDVVALAMAYAALRLAQRPPTERHTYGFGRTEVLVAEVNALLLFAGAVAVGVEAIRRLEAPESIDGVAVAVIGGLGLAVNFGSALVVHRTAGRNLNMRAAVWHLGADAAGSLVVVIAGVGSALFDVERLDPIASLVISALVVVAAWRVMRGATRVLLEAVPEGLDGGSVRAALRAQPGVEAVHHLHVWTTGSEHAALSAHVVLGDTMTLHDAQVRAGELKQMLAERFGIEHATLEVECHDCIDDDAHL